jgi:hydroxymethylpyrimidine kinase/phosphomethylpyrimidine kinase/thiamine-phosphate diphosphorylase
MGIYVFIYVHLYVPVYICIYIYIYVYIYMIFIRDDNKECEIPIDITSVKDMEDAARGIYGLGPVYVLVKGGHLAPTNTTGEMVDVLYDGQKFTHIKGPQVSTENVHGTGCTLSSAIASELARGSTVLQAVLSARKYLTQTLEMSASSTIGTGSHGPLLHMAPLFANVMPVSTTNVHAPMGSDVPRVLNPVDLSVYAVTDPSLNEKYGHTMEEAVAAAVAGGATIVQIREKNITTAEFIDMSRRVLQITRRAGVPLIINDRVDVALAIGADGVHVGQSDMNAAEVRRLIGPGLILGVSTKSPEEALKAQADGADYVGSGAVYPTNTKVVTRELGVDGLKGVCSTPGLVIPVVAIGGISGAERVNSCLVEGGAQGVAVVSAIFGVADVYAATLALTDEVCICTYVRVFSCTITQIYIFMYTHLFISTYIRIYIICMYIYICIYIHIYISLICIYNR